MVKISYLEDDEELAYSLKCLNTRYTDNLFFSFFERHFFLNLLRINKREFFLIFIFYSYTITCNYHFTNITNSKSEKILFYERQ